MYRHDLINAAMGAKRLTNAKVAQVAHVAIMTVSKIRNGNPHVELPSLEAVVKAVGLTLEEVFQDKAA